MQSVATAGLGFWQSQRYFWKIDLLKDDEANAKMESVDVSELDVDRLGYLFSIHIIVVV